MQITTKYSIGQTLWTIKEGKVAKFIVHTISVKRQNDKEVVTYISSPQKDKHIFIIDEENCFLSKEALMEYIYGSDCVE